jgi:hypothetical protein
MKYHWLVDFDDRFTLEGWADLTVNWDLDGEFKSLDVNALAIEPPMEIHKKIERGFRPITDDVPEGRLWDLIQFRIIDHLEGPALDEVMELACAQGEGPNVSRHPGNWIYGGGYNAK